MAGEQYSTIFKDTRELARVTVDMIKALAEGEEPEVNDTETYDNGVKVVPSYLLDPVPVEQGRRPDGARRLGLLHAPTSSSDPARPVVPGRQPAARDAG